MNEQTINEGTQKERAVGNSNDGNQPEAYSLIEQANAAAERMERANKEKAFLLAREEQLMARQTLVGKSLPNQQPEPPKKLTPKEYVEFMQRTGKVPPADM